MFQGKSIVLIIPARNEELALPSVLTEIPPFIDKVIVADNGSTDDTPRIAEAHGACVVTELRAGYGRACLAALKILQSAPPDIVAFADADGSDPLFRIEALLNPLASGDADLVLGSRVSIERGALSLQQKIGNRIVTRLIALIWRHTYADLGPMRAVTWSALRRLEMSDPNYGWTVEMQIRALVMGLRVRELPVPYRKRIAGRSKVSRSIFGSLKAGTKMFWVIAREMMQSSLRRRKAYSRCSDGCTGS